MAVTCGAAVVQRGQQDPAAGGRPAEPAPVRRGAPLAGARRAAGRRPSAAAAHRLGQGEARRLQQTAARLSGESASRPSGRRGGGGSVGVLSGGRGQQSG